MAKRVPIIPVSTTYDPNGYASATPTGFREMPADDQIPEQNIPALPQSKIENLPDDLTAIVSQIPTPFVHIQSSAATVWIVNHNLGYEPLPEVINAGGEKVIAEIINFTVNQLRVYFAVAATGKVRCI